MVEKHRHVDATLLHSERIAPFAQLASPEVEPVEVPSRVQVEWIGHRFVEVDVLRPGKPKLVGWGRVRQG